jgi:hypothetical protein
MKLSNQHFAKKTLNIKKVQIRRLKKGGVKYLLSGVIFIVLRKLKGF